MVEHRQVETDYLVVGAGAMGMAFVDSLIEHSDADVVMVERRHRAGGHWLDSYPFVQLHQPSANYGVNSTVLGQDRIEPDGSDAGFPVLANGKLLPRLGPRPLVPTGMVLAAVGLIIFTRLGAHSDYVTHILPGLLVLGVGIGLAVSSSTNTATAGVEPDDAGVASAMVNTSQQIGGSIGTSFLKTLAAAAVTTFVASHQAGPTLAAQAALHSYTVVFWWSAGILAAGAVATLLLFRSGAVAPAPDEHARPALVHSSS